jgi:predicted 3-demethylubiquinone-9 3-methyltransferase (glyoxalase superfamily)
MMKNSIYPCLWLAGTAKEAADFYTTLFESSEIIADTDLVVTFDLQGHHFMALNGAPIFSPNSSISFFVVCETIEETEHLWQGLCNGGNILMSLDKYDWSEKYGWVADRYGVNWQISLGKISDAGQKISPLLMFCGSQQGKAEAALHFYTSVFGDSVLTGIYRYPENAPDTAGQIVHSQFVIEGNVMMAMDSGVPQPFTFSEGISLVKECQTQEEIDYYWNTFTKDGEESMCGWCKDPFGVSWQIIPAELGTLVQHSEKGPGVMQALMKMRKIILKDLKEV